MSIEYRYTYSVTACVILLSACTAADTQVAVDTQVAADTQVADTQEADTTPADIQVADTSLADAQEPDTTPADTQESDTAPADTGVADTGSPDTGVAEDTVSSLCETYCSLVKLACTGENAIDFGDSGCLTACAAWDEGGVEGNTVQCRIYHATIAIQENPEVHCVHASPGGGGVCVDKPPTPCEVFCTLAATNCKDENVIDFGEAGCVDTCATWEPGSAGATTGDSLACRLHHAGAPAAEDPGTHCPHASPDGGGVCAVPPKTFCEATCDTVEFECLKEGAPIGAALKACLEFCNDAEAGDCQDEWKEFKACHGPDGKWECKDLSFGPLACVLESNTWSTCVDPMPCDALPCQNDGLCLNTEGPLCQDPAGCPDATCKAYVCSKDNWCCSNWDATCAVCAAGKTLDNLDCSDVGDACEASSPYACFCSAGFTGQNCEQKATPCEEYCALVGINCAGDNAVSFPNGDCLGYCKKLEQGEPGDTVGNTFQCRLYHAGAPAAADPATGCPNASPDGGEACVVQTPYCEAMCDTLGKNWECGTTDGCKADCEANESGACKAEWLAFEKCHGPKGEWNCILGADNPADCKAEYAAWNQCKVTSQCNPNPCENDGACAYVSKPVCQFVLSTCKYEACQEYVCSKIGQCCNSWSEACSSCAAGEDNPLADCSDVGGKCGSDGTYKCDCTPEFAGKDCDQPANPCEEYCALTALKCTGKSELSFPGDDCMAYCESLPEGEAGDLIGNNLQCRLTFAKTIGSGPEEGAAEIDCLDNNGQYQCGDNPCVPAAEPADAWLDVTPESCAPCGPPNLQTWSPCNKAGNCVCGKSSDPVVACLKAGPESATCFDPLTYNEDAQPVFEKYCGLCHSAGSNSYGGTGFAKSYDEAMKPFTGGSFYCKKKEDGGVLLKAMNVAECTVELMKKGQMPWNKQCLDAKDKPECPNQEDIDIIQAWINQGMYE
jgi:hypothetical protein